MYIQRIMVTVSDVYFTSNQQSVTIPIPNKIKVCHRDKNVISVGKMDVPNHLAHGDCIASCADGADKGKPSAARLATANNILVYPNPADDRVNINLGKNFDNIRKIEVVDLSGSIIMQLSVGKIQNIVIPSGRLKRGTYMLRMQGDKIISPKDRDSVV